MPLTHDDAIAASIRMNFDNALDDMHDDGISDKWIDAIAERRNSLIDLIALRHAISCSRGAEPLNCDECSYNDHDFHFTMHNDTDPCYTLIHQMIYDDFIRPRWENEPMMTEPGHIARDNTNRGE